MFEICTYLSTVNIFHFSYEKWKVNIYLITEDFSVVVKIKFDLKYFLGGEVFTIKVLTHTHFTIKNIS